MVPLLVVAAEVCGLAAVAWVGAGRSGRHALERSATAAAGPRSLS
jgi:hypothetical protein